MEKGKLDRLTKDIVKCERCDRAVWCMQLKSCEEFTPAISTNFYVEVNGYDKAKKVYQRHS